MIKLYRNQINWPYRGGGAYTLPGHSEKTESTRHD